MFTLNLEPWVQSSVPQSPLVTARINPTAMPGVIQNQSHERVWDSAQFRLQGPEEMGQTVILLAEQITFAMLPPSHPGFPAAPTPLPFVYSPQIGLLLGLHLWALLLPPYSHFLGRAPSPDAPVQFGMCEHPRYHTCGDSLKGAPPEQEILPLSPVAHILPLSQTSLHLLTPALRAFLEFTVGHVDHALTMVTRGKSGSLGDKLGTCSDSRFLF